MNHLESQDIKLKEIINKFSESFKELKTDVNAIELSISYEETRIISNFCLKYFYQSNYCGPDIKSIVSLFQIERDAEEKLNHWCREKLSVNSEQLVHSVKNPFLLWIAVKFTYMSPECLQDAIEQLLIILIWSQMFQDPVSYFKDLCLNLIQTIYQLTTENTDKTQFIHSYFVLLQFHLIFKEFDNAKKIIDKLSNYLEIDAKLIGVLGKRTKFQQFDLAQLALQIDTNEVLINHEINENLPTNVALNDDTLLEEIHYTCELRIPDLNHYQQNLLLYICLYKLKSSPKHELLNEQATAYLNAVIQNPKNYLIGRSALYLRSSLEHESTRKLERSLLQLETLVNEYTEPKEKLNGDTWKCLFALSHWKIKELLASILFKMSCINSALEIYLELKSYDDIIDCYIATGRRQRAQEVIESEIQERGQNPHLLCLIGKINDDPSYYYKALELSNNKSFRAFYELGNYYLKRKQYSECVLNFEHALSINSIQPFTWYNLGCIYMELKDLNKAATAIRTCCHIQPDNFKAWTNLASILVQQNKLESAFNAIKTAISCNYDHSHIWIKYAHISIDLNRGSDVLRALERLVDIQPNMVDNEIIAYLVKYYHETDDIQSHINFYDRLVQCLLTLSNKISPCYKFWWLFSRLIQSTSSMKSYEYLANSLQELVYKEQQIASNAKDILLICQEMDELNREQLKNEGINKSVELILCNIENRLKNISQTSNDEVQKSINDIIYHISLLNLKF